MHSLSITLITIAAALSSLASLPAASSQVQSPASKPAGPVQHKVAKGETMWSISQKHQTSVGEIMEFNNLGTHVVREGMTLKIPGRATVTPGKTSEAALPRPSSRDSIHLVKPGENFWTIAEKYKINPQALAQANPNVNPNRMHPDMELNIPSKQLATAAEKTTTSTTALSTTKPAPAKAGEHILAEGETFYSIAQKRGIKVSDLVAANPTLKPERLRTGTKINIPGGSSTSTTAANTKSTTPSKPAQTPATTASANKQAVAKRHTVADGESLASIAKRYSISTDSLLKQNNLKDTDSIYIGDVLSIPGAASSATQSKTASANTSSSSKPAPANTTASNSKTSNTTASPTIKPATKTTVNAPLHVADDGSVRSYIVSAGENEETICEAFGITKKELFEHNKLTQGSKLRPGDEIMIPATTKKVVAR